jgi:hypothetical protein
MSDRYASDREVCADAHGWQPRRALVDGPRQISCGRTGPLHKHEATVELRSD